MVDFSNSGAMCTRNNQERRPIMSTATITFRQCIQDSQDYGSSEEHMVSRVFFSMNYKGKSYDQLYVDLKQTVGSKFDPNTIEVSAPKNYDGPFGYQTFRSEVVSYYQNLIGSEGSFIKIANGCKNIRMRNNTLVETKTIQIDM